MPSTPFQINQFQSKSLLRDGEFMTMVWTFNMSHWKISTRFPQCQSHLINMEMGIEQWFGRRTTQTRSKRGVLCLEIQIEYSSNLKLTAQALQSGITPLGILRNLPVEYDFALNHTDLWVNKWLVMCFPGQDKVIYHSCFHNHSSCHARIETVQTLHDLVTPILLGY
ncbi:uncharacterized protein ACNLHF_022793 [Anomaloglossus baeobatrachus]